MRRAQADVWGFFSDASLYGMEVYTISGTRGPAMAYYVPMLSALRLLLPADAPAAVWRLFCFGTWGGAVLVYWP